jgi:transcriptional antiterminator RfaH
MTRTVNTPVPLAPPDVVVDAPVGGASAVGDDWRWYVVQCKAREEHRALENLERQGYRCLLPLCEKEVVRKARRTVVSEPLFPRYLFVALSRVQSDWSRIRSTRGVSRLVQFGTQFPSLSAETVDLLCRVRPDRQILFEPGSVLRITEGAFAGLEAIYLEPDGEARVIILFELLGARHKGSFPVSSVAKAVAA